MPLIRRMPKRGFNNARFTTQYIPVNVGDLNRFDNGISLDEAALRASGLVNGKGAGVKILGDGELSKKLVITVHACSATARAKIEKLGGSCTLIPPKPPTVRKAKKA